MGKFSKRSFTLGDYWLTQRGSGWFRTWYDPTSKQTKRAALGTDSEEVARERLTKWYLENARDKVQTSTATLAEIFTSYEHNHAAKLRSYKTVQILLRYWSEYWGDVDVSLVKPVAKQEEFQQFLLGKGLAVNSVNRVLEIGRAAINRAWKRGMIDSAPFIHVLPKGEDKPKGRPLTVEEMQALYYNASDHIRVFMVLMLGTAARNEAVTSLTWPQIDFENGLVHLNPEGRKQTSKRRPTVRLIPSVREVLEPMDKKSSAVIMFRGQKLAKIRTGWDRAVERAELDGDVTPYSCRHSAARWMRKEGVPPWETAAQLGHRLPGYSMSERYAAFSPDYLEKASMALDKLVRLAVPSDAPKIPSGR